MKPKVYVESSILSYLVARRSKLLVTAAYQEVTVDWWASRDQFDLYVSDAVIQEIGRGDPSYAEKRLEAAKGLGRLRIIPEAEDLARKLLEASALPQKAWVDSVHIAIAAVHGMDYLLTWNCKHIANAVMRPKIERTCRESGFEPPVICTPEELDLEESE